MKGDFWRQRFEDWGARVALIRADKQTPYSELLRRVAEYGEQLAKHEIDANSVVLLKGDYDEDSIALLLALFNCAATVAPIANLPPAKVDEFATIAEAGCKISGSEGLLFVTKTDLPVTHGLTKQILGSGRPGLILFTSGSTGQPKASLHDAYRLLKKFVAPHQSLVTLAMPPFDHIAGLDSLFYTLTSGGTLICPESRTPEEISRLIEEKQVELLPCSATFLRLLIVSEAYKRHSFQSVKVVAYGSDIMPAETLNSLAGIFPKAKFLQKYGTTELGSPPTHSREDKSLWMKIDSPDYEVKIVDGVLHIRSDSAMLGYLNAPSPIDEDGWLNTQDLVEVEGEYFKILGRQTDIINVGGEKVYPIEVENLILQMDGVEDVTVHGEKNNILGNIVVARVQLQGKEDTVTFRSRMTAFLKDKLEPYKIPVKIVAASEEYGDRFKKKRSEL